MIFWRIKIKSDVNQVDSTLPEMINASFAQIGKHIGARLTVTFSHQVAAQLSELPEPLLCRVSVQPSMIPSET
jgi:hypothetical protein